MIGNTMKKNIKVNKEIAAEKKIDADNLSTPTLDEHFKVITKEICNALKLGAYLETAASFAGVDNAILKRWLRKGKRIRDTKDKDKQTKKDRLYVKFFLAIKKAMSEAELNDLRKIEAASFQDWKAAAWRLSRRHASRWSGTRTVDHKINPISVDHKHLVEIDYDALPLDVCEKLLKMARQGQTQSDEKLMIEVKPEYPEESSE